LGDHVALYYGGTYKIPVIVEVVAAAVFDPARVQREGRLRGARIDEGERWPWLTEVVGRRQKTVAAAPSLADVGLDPTIVMRRTRSLLSDETYRRLDQMLAA
jgi:hypothetical protein